jgi:hypothetical protein
MDRKKALVVYIEVIHLGLNERIKTTNEVARLRAEISNRISPITIQ